MDQYLVAALADLDRVECDTGLARGGEHPKRRLLATDTYRCMFNADRVGVLPPISLEDYVRMLPTTRIRRISDCGRRWCASQRKRRRNMASRDAEGAQADLLAL